MKIPTLLCTVLAALFFGFGVQAATLDDAHREFAGGKFSESTQAYEDVLAHDGYSAPVLFDLGNSYYREGNIAQAILAYKQAQLLSPGDPDIAANLNLAQKQAGVAEVEPGAIEKAGRFLSASGWAWLASGAWTLLCVSLLARTVLARQAGLFTGTGLVSVAVLLMAIAGMVVSSHELNEAVVTEKNAAALISPFPAAQAAFTVTPGETVKVGKSYDDFLFVADKAGHTGWISRGQVSPVVPALHGSS